MWRTNWASTSKEQTMTKLSRFKNSRGALAAGAAVLLALGAAGGAGAVHATRPAVVMAPTVQTPIAKLPATSGVVTVKGRVAEVYGDRFVVQDGSGRTMIAAGRESGGTVRVGQPMLVQGRYDDGQLRASYLVDQNGVVAVGPRPGGPKGAGGPRPHGPGRDGAPPPPPGCASAPGGSDARGALPLPPAMNGATSAPIGRVSPTAPLTAPRS
jgi:hypothetical protein